MRFTSHFLSALLLIVPTSAYCQVINGYDIGADTAIHIVTINDWDGTGKVWVDYGQLKVKDADFTENGKQVIIKGCVQGANYFEQRGWVVVNFASVYSPVTLRTTNTVMLRRKERMKN